MTTFGRRPLQIVEIDQDRCDRTYARLPCRAHLERGVARTNTFLHSTAAANAWWTKSRTTATDNFAASPTGETNAARLMDDTTTGEHSINRPGIAWTAGQVQTMSTFVAAGTITRIAMRFGTGTAVFPTSGNWVAVFDLAAGTVLLQGSSVVATIEPAGAAGWWRCSIRGAAAASGSDTAFPTMLVASGTATSYTGTGAGAVLIFGRQLEVGAGASTLKTTTTAPVAEWWGTGPRNCFNTMTTCQDPANFRRGAPTVLRVGPNATGLPLTSPPVMPSLLSVSTRPAQLNSGALDRRVGPLGARAEVTVTIGDHRAADFDIDPYRDQRASGAAQADGVGYRPEERGSFWRRMRARSTHWAGRPLRVLEGFEGQAIAAMRTRHYVIRDVTGPDASGVVTFRAADVLDLADNDRALCPRPSTGTLSHALAAAQPAGQTFTVEQTPGQYGTGGLVRIGAEIIRFTRSGPTFTITERGVAGTAAASHDAGAAVQRCEDFVSVPMPTAMRRLLVDFAGVPAAFVPLADWEAEHAAWHPEYRVTRIVSRPAGVATLVAEMIAIAGTLWWDDVAQRLRYRAARPRFPHDPEIILTDDPSLGPHGSAHAIDASVRVETRADMRISTVMVWHGMLDVTGSTSDGRNYGRLAVASDPAQAGADRYGQEQVRQMHAPWLGRAGDDSVAQPHAVRTLWQATDPPWQIVCDIDAKDAAALVPGTMVTFISHTVQGADGTPVRIPAQVTAAEELIGGHAWRVTLLYTGPEGRFGLITEDTRPDYAASTAAERLMGSYIADDLGRMPDGTPAYQMF